jgi:hypothetical protein
VIRFAVDEMTAGPAVTPGLLFRETPRGRRAAPAKLIETPAARPAWLKWAEACIPTQSRQNMC